jgi:2-keto-4-pentenoate hydratase
MAEPGTSTKREEVTRAAQLLADEHRSGVRFHPFAAAAVIMSIDDAYAVQREFVRIQPQESGAGLAGYKIGLTVKRMQEMCGIDSPIAGVIFDDRVHKSGARLRASDYGKLGIEFEIAVRMARDLRPNGGALSLADVAAAVDAICPAFEIIDDRHADYGNLEILSLIADNAWNAGIVLGDFVKPWPDLAAIEGVVAADGTVVDRGLGRDVLGHPFHSVAWLAAHLARMGTKLRAGEIIMTGSLALTRFPDRAGAYRFELGGLGAVEIAIDV